VKIGSSLEYGSDSKLVKLSITLFSGSTYQMNHPWARKPANPSLSS